MKHQHTQNLFTKIHHLCPEYTWFGKINLIKEAIFSVAKHQAEYKYFLMPCRITIAHHSNKQYTLCLSIGNALLCGPSCLPLSRTLCIRPSTLLCIGPPARISSKSRRADCKISQKQSLSYLTKLKTTNKPINTSTITFDPPCFEKNIYTYWKINGRICSHLIDIG